jgi:hypothetical protein
MYFAEVECSITIHASEQITLNYPGYKYVLHYACVATQMQIMTSFKDTIKYSSVENLNNYR